MMHFTCDRCGKLIGQGDRHHVVRIEVTAAFDPNELSEEDLDADHLKEVGDLIKAIEADPNVAAAEVPKTRSLRRDLCGDCVETFVQHPVGHETGIEKKAFYSPN
ncbi:MAG: hypothetical protein K2X38_14510 [Gemmataceae bacterium]|nr:hypothetical protein [Gemmataceae bacterium]